MSNEVDIQELSGDVRHGPMRWISKSYQMSNEVDIQELSEDVRHGPMR